MQEVHDVDRYREEYLPGWRALLRKLGEEVLVADFEAKPVEGDPPNGTVVLRFADAAAAWPCSTTPITGA
jgi:uncharacterized protein (DUF1330 family)